jgi:Animal haem peroxidase
MSKVTYSGNHAAEPRGLGASPRSRSFEGRFGRLFRTLEPADFSDGSLTALAAAMKQPPEDEKPLGEEDGDENPVVPAGYTYFGQFIDHDLTFDPSSSLQRAEDPEALINFRTPRFDLDSVYGRGPDAQPYLYQGAELSLGSGLFDRGAQVGNDLPRAPNGRAIIGDPRNDENKIVSQIHGAFLRLHNRAVRDEGEFSAAQQRTRFTYQWLVLHDYLPRIVGRDMVGAILQRRDEVVGTDAAGATISMARYVPAFRFFAPRESAFMPVEFSGAAFRFGHSMVRPGYFLNEGQRNGKFTGRVPLFSPTASNPPDLRGFGPPPAEWGIDWRYFFALGGLQSFPQASYKIDHLLVDPLGLLPTPVVPEGSERSLPLRNLKMGKALRLPSGQDVARILGLPVLSDSDLFAEQLAPLMPEFRSRAPLWFYILREADLYHQGLQLGPVGGRIVAETLLGLLWHDPTSFVRVDPAFEPAARDVGSWLMLGSAG